MTYSTLTEFLSSLSVREMKPVEEHLDAPDALGGLRQLYQLIVQTHALTLDLTDPDAMGELIRWLAEHRSDQMHWAVERAFRQMIDELIRWGESLPKGQRRWLESVHRSKARWTT